jgi:arylsulfatase
VWELYAPDDCSQARNVVADHPEKLAEMQRLWLIEAVKYNVVPLDDRSYERINPDLAGRPQLVTGTSQTLFAGMRVAEGCIINLKNKSHSVTAEITVPDEGAKGVIATQGGFVGGWALYAYEGRLKYCYNFFGLEHYFAEASQRIPSGKRQVRMEFNCDGGGLAKGGDVTLYCDGKEVGKGRVDKTEPMGYSADEACDVGSDTGSPASPDYGATGNAFNGNGFASISATTTTAISSPPRIRSRWQWRASSAEAQLDTNYICGTCKVLIAPMPGNVHLASDTDQPCILVCSKCKRLIRRPKG